MAKQKDDISIEKDKQGKFTAWAKKNGFKDACSAASAVMKKKDKYSSNVVKMANYANNFGCKTKKESPATMSPYKLTEKQKKLPQVIQDAILAKEGKSKESPAKNGNIPPKPTSEKEAKAYLQTRKGMTKAMRSTRKKPKGKQ
jgi:isoaspartyl peptidase/L-asparaginase-like protein (Ntn-hydrolase superfamily)